MKVESNFPTCNISISAVTSVEYAYCQYTFPTSSQQINEHLPIANPEGCTTNTLAQSEWSWVAASHEAWITRQAPPLAKELFGAYRVSFDWVATGCGDPTGTMIATFISPNNWYVWPQELRDDCI